MCDQIAENLEYLDRIYLRKNIYNPKRVGQNLHYQDGFEIECAFDSYFLVRIDIGLYYMLKLTSRYEGFRLDEFTNHFIDNEPFRFTNFEEFEGEDWLNKWLDKVIPRYSEEAIHCDKMYKKLNR